MCLLSMVYGISRKNHTLCCHKWRPGSRTPLVNIIIFVSTGPDYVFCPWFQFADCQRSVHFVVSNLDFFFCGLHLVLNYEEYKLFVVQSVSCLLRGHLGVPDTVSEPLIVPLNYLVILHLIHLNAYRFEGDSKHMTSEIECFHRYGNSADIPLVAVDVLIIHY